MEIVNLVKVLTQKLKKEEKHLINSSKKYEQKENIEGRDLYAQTSKAIGEMRLNLVDSMAKIKLVEDIEAENRKLLANAKKGTLKYSGVQNKRKDRVKIFIEEEKAELQRRLLADYEV